MSLSIQSPVNWQPVASLFLYDRAITVSIATKLTLILSGLSSPGQSDNSVVPSCNNEEHFFSFNDSQTAFLPFIVLLRNNYIKSVFPREMEEEKNRDVYDYEQTIYENVK